MDTRKFKVVQTSSRQVAKPQRLTEKNLASVFLLTTVFCLLSPAVRAQVATGTPPFGSFSGGPDIINNANLNVHFSIPVVSKAGRGLPFNYSLSYDTSVWYPVTSGGNQSWQPVNNWGWNTWSGGQTGTMYYTQQTNYCSFWTGYNWQQAPYEVVVSDFIYYDPNGASHQFPGRDDIWSNPGHGCPSGTSTWDIGAVATDGSGYVFNGQSWTLTPPNGGTFTPPYQQATGAGSVSDANGNTISNTTGGVFTDTLGTTALTVSGNGTPSSPMTFQYTGAGGAATVKVQYISKTVQTAFGCGSIGEFGPTVENLVSEIDLPDDNPSGTRDRYLFAYEGTPGHSGNYTGRLASVTLPTGGTISYLYKGANNGITCADGSAVEIWRYTPDTGSNYYWDYARTNISGTEWKTLVTDPKGNPTTYYFQFVTPSGSTTSYAYETERDLPGGGETISTCYNGASKPCNTTAISGIGQRTVWVTLGSQTSELDTYYDGSGYGLPVAVNEYDWGPALARKTQIFYDYNNPCGVTNSSVVNKVCSVVVRDGSNNLVANPTFAYDGNGNLQKATPSVGPQIQFTYNSNGTVATSNDGAGTTYYYYNSSSCNAFPYSVVPPTGPSTSLSWNCNGAVVTSVNTGNGASSYVYDNMNRVTSVTDPNQAATTIANKPTSVESTLNFNSGVSTMDSLITLDVLGRPHISQRKQSPSGNYDSSQTGYDALGRPSQLSVPYSASGGTGYTCGSCTTTAYYATGQVQTITDPDGGTLTFAYPSNDVQRTLTPAPSGEKAKNVQYEYDGLGRLTSVCEMTTVLSGYGTCGQTTSQYGFWTKYTYNALNKLTAVAQNAQSSSPQPRTYNFDAAGRLTSETNPETGTMTYSYDSDSTCGSSAGDMVKKVDAMSNANVTCFHYDTIHRLASITYPSGAYAGVTPSKTFVYGTNTSTTACGQTLNNTAGRLVEAYTGPQSAKISDECFSYDADGNVTQIWESTPHSSGYYEVKAATYWPNGLPETLQLLNNGGGALIPQISYNSEGEGRVGSTSVSSGQNPVSSTSYNLWGLTNVNYGSGDGDIFGYDAGTGRMTSYDFWVNNAHTMSGTLTWNANGTLGSLGISDAYNSADTQSCTYSYDDLARLAGANCGSAWNQSFSADPFGNLKKTGQGGGAESFQPTYNLFNQVSALGTHAPTYDADGNTTNDTVNSYSWDSDGNMISATTPSATTNVTYDAMDRAVEFLVGSSYTEIVYGPGGGKLALMSGQTLTKAFVPLAGGATAVYNSSGLAYYRHADWLGSSRLASTPSRGVYYDGAYAPYGENYAETGTTDRSFTGQNQDMVSTGSYPLYDFLMRGYHPTWGRWISPDPSGLAAVDPTSPQTWNRYAYVLNNPTSFTDPLGLHWECITTSFNGGPPHTTCTWVPDPAPVPEPVNPCALVSPAAYTGPPSCSIIYPTGDPGPMGPTNTGSGSGSGSWTQAFVNDFVTNFADRFHKSCFGQFLTNTGENFITPGASSLGPAAGEAYGARMFNQALQYAASTPSKTFGTPFLVYPQKSSVFRSLMSEARSGAGVGLMLQVDISMVQALIKEANAAYNGGCE